MPSIARSGQLGLRADHVEVPARARIERQRQPVVAAARDVPVAHVAQPVVHALAHVLRHPLDLRVLLEQLRPDLVDRDEPVVGDPEDQRRVAAPAVRVGVRVQPGLDEEPGFAEPADDLVGRVGGREAVQPAVVVVEAPRLVDRRQHRQVVHLRELEVLAAAAGRDVDEAGALVHRHVVPRDDAVLDLRPWSEIVERSLVPPTDELVATQTLDERVVRVQLDGDPLAVLAAAVLLVGMHGDRDVGGERPRRRRPDDERLARPVEQREADEERRVGAVLVDAGLRQLVLRERRPAARAPFRRAVALDQHAPRVHELEELPDVLDVRVAEGEVVVAPVHPLPEALRAARQRGRRPDDDVAALPGERLEPVLLDLRLRVEAQLALDADLDPEALAVEAVLVALVEAAQPLVALEDVLERPPPRRVNAEGEPVGGDRAVDERPLRAAAVSLAKLRERVLPLPDLEQLELDCRMIRLVGKASEHVSIVSSGKKPSGRGVCNSVRSPERKRWQRT